MTGVERQLYRLMKRKLTLENKFHLIKGELDGVNQQVYTIQQYQQYIDEVEKNKFKPVIHNR